MNEAAFSSPSKYGNKRAEADGIMFHSKRERDRYLHLRLLIKAGIISKLEFQPRFKLHVSGVHICDYVADFRYIEDGHIITEDCKGHRTREYIIKRRLMKAIYGIEVKET